MRLRIRRGQLVNSWTANVPLPGGEECWDFRTPAELVSGLEVKEKRMATFGARFVSASILPSSGRSPTAAMPVNCAI